MNASWSAMLSGWTALWEASMWRACWQGGVAILLVWALCRALPRLSPRVRCWFWRLAYLKLMVALFWATPIDIPLLHPSALPQVSVAQAAPESDGPAFHLPSRHGAQTQSAPAKAPQTSKLPLIVLLPLAWLLGVIGLCASILRERRAALRQTHCAPLDPRRYPELTAEFAALCLRIGIRRPVALLVTDVSAGPQVFGVLHPAILLPSALLAEQDPARLQAILMHELAHIRRRDLLWNWLPALVHTLFYFHPLVWLANHEWQLAQETACDEMAVLTTRTDIADYGETLVQMVAQNRRFQTRGLASLGIAESPQLLKRRLRAMQSLRPVSPRRLILTGAVSILIGTLGIIPWQVVAQQGPKPILFASNRADAKQFNIFSMAPDGSHVVRLTHGTEKSMEMDPVWSPDRKRIAFTVVEGTGPEGVVKSDLYVMNADGSERHKLTESRLAMLAMAPAWSPDGKQIAYNLAVPSENENPFGIAKLNIMDADGKNVKEIGEGFWPQWSPDGKKIAYSVIPPGKDDIVSKPSLYIMDADGANAHKVADHAMQGAWSSDGKRLLYASIEHDEGQPNLVVSEADGSRPHRITSAPDTGGVGPQWSADGKQVFFTKIWDPTKGLAQNSQIYRMDADGSHRVALTKGNAPDYLGSAPGVFLMVGWIDHLLGTNAAHTL
ncbi:MAG TPA: M56 family metallopeptidase [Chthonomonadaceae bacterium]|nr:M56 family metallopeptidase [Chthonomonadaceae bacterium]